MKITRTVVTNIYTAHYAEGIVEEIRGRYSYAMELEDFIKNAAVVEG